jgi:exodeoxyribonuclease-3
VYVPNSGSKLARLDYRTNDWDKKFIKLCKRLEKEKPLIIAGDMNVAHMDMDIKHPERHKQSAGFTDAERGNFDKLLRTCNLLDSWRIFHSNEICYTYFDYRTKARQRNAGWRIDYILISSILEYNITDTKILSNVYGSDHLPITCTLNLAY